METIAPSTPEYAVLAGQSSAGFWRRLFAFAIDGIIAAIPCFTLAEAFHNFFLESPVTAKLAGFVITLAYFAIFGSKIVDGQTLGMMAFRLRIVRHDGSMVSFSRSTLRYLLLLVPFLLDSGALPARVPASIADLWGSVLAIVACAIVYFAIFNRKTGQSLHDLIMDTFVVDSSGAGPVRTERFWRPHWVFIAGLLILGYGLAKIIPRTSSTFSELTAIRGSVQGRTGLQSVNVALRFSGGRSGLEIDGECDRVSSEPAKSAAVIAAAVLVADNEAKERDYIAIGCVRTVSVGFFKSTNRESFMHTPEEWKQMIQNSR